MAGQQAEVDDIILEARKLASLLPTDIDLQEARRTVNFYIQSGYKDQKLVDYLNAMVVNPPQRSQRTRIHYQKLQKAISQWDTALEGREKAMAIGWAIRMVAARKRHAVPDTEQDL